MTAIEKRAAERAARRRRKSVVPPKRNERLPVRVSSKLYALWKRKAATAGVTLTEWIEIGLNAAARRQ